MGKAVLGPCPSCGSRDNLARYDDGSAWCFGCRYYERRTGYGNGPIPDVQRSDADADAARLRKSLQGTVRTFPEPIVNFLARYEISVVTALSRGLLYHPGRNQLIFTYYDKENKLTCIQARNFDPDRASKGKYDGRGSTASAFPIYKSKTNSGPMAGHSRSDGVGPIVMDDIPFGDQQHQLILTEDALSAIKIAENYDAIPCLGTNFQTHKIVEAQRLGYQSIIVWLDSDKWREARHISDNCKWLGLSSRTILTEHDPKAYSHSDIAKYLT